jgi:hypothetical protein
MRTARSTATLSCGADGNALREAATALDALSQRPIDDPERASAYLRYLTALKARERALRD